REGVTVLRSGGCSCPWYRLECWGTLGLLHRRGCRERAGHTSPVPGRCEGVRSGGLPRSPCGLAVLLHHRLEALPLAGRGAGLEGDGLLADLGEAVLLPPIERSGDGAARGRWVAALTDQLGDAVRGEGLATRV